MKVEIISYTNVLEGELSYSAHGTDSESLNCNDLTLLEESENIEVTFAS